MDASDCKTKDDILLHLISNLNFVSGEVLVDDYQQCLGFRRWMCTSQVWYNKTTKKWAYHVSDDAFKGDPNMGVYDSLAELLYGVSNFYANLWKGISNDPITINIISYADSIAKSYGFLDSKKK
jgi:hypothetical protein